MSGAKRPLYKAAIQTLGIEKLNIENDEEKFNQWLEDNVLASKEEKKKDCNPFRNFIAKQIIENRRFMYLVRYTKPQTARTLMNNRHVVRFVLQRIANIKADHITESQIDRYYQCLPSYREHVKVDLKTKITTLTNYLVQYSFEKNVLKKEGKPEESYEFNVRSSKYDKDAIEHLKALTGLYLSVAYIAVKNLVKANARYYIAFSIFERDYELLQRKVGKKNLEKYLIPFQFVDDKGEIKDAKNKFFALTEHFLDSDNSLRYQWNPDLSIEENKQALRKHIDDKTIRSQRHFTQEWLDIFQGNLEDAEKRNKKPKEGNLKTAKRIHPTGLLLTAARNHAEHLNALTRLPDFIGGFKGDTKNTSKPRNLYFQLYHYLVQCLLFEDGDLHDSLLEYEKKVKPFGTPSSDLINITYVSLGYNLPRYKNLTIEGLFEEQR